MLNTNFGRRSKPRAASREAIKHALPHTASGWTIAMFALGPNCDVARVRHHGGFTPESRHSLTLQYLSRWAKLETSRVLSAARIPYFVKAAI
jgi:hypothetical protein